MNTRTKILLGCLVLLALLSLACTDLDIDRSGWGMVSSTPVQSNPAEDAHIQHMTDVTLGTPTPEN